MEGPWWGWRKEGTSDHHHCWSQFLAGFIHPVWWHPPDDGRLCRVVAVAEAEQFATPGWKQHQQLALDVVVIFRVFCRGVQDQHQAQQAICGGHVQQAKMEAVATIHWQGGRELQVRVRPP